MKYNYAFDVEKQNQVKVVGRDLNISTKQAIEICSFIKKMPLKKARATLEKVEKKKLAIPFKRFTEGAGHKKGVGGTGAGKYPVLASKQFLKLLKSLESNAQNKGLSSELRIIHACAQRASTPFHYGRKRRIKMKRTHVELVAEETEPEKKSEKRTMKKEEAQKQTPKRSKEEIGVEAKNKPEQKTGGKKKINEKPDSQALKSTKPLPEQEKKQKSLSRVEVKK